MLMNYLEEIGSNAKQAAARLNLMLQEDKNAALRSCAQALLDAKQEILTANEKDVQIAQSNGVKASLIDRLQLTPERLQGMADGLLEICALPDPIGEVLSMTVRPNGLNIGQKVVPLGVVGIIYESRPNVTSRCFRLVFQNWKCCYTTGRQ